MLHAVASHVLESVKSELPSEPSEKDEAVERNLPHVAAKPATPGSAGS